ncbi:MAG TPA: biosynthetic peptidoglycan transglycosylase, partial [Microcoleaceae cyanobacterium]
MSYKGRSIYRYKRFWLAVVGVGAGGALAWGYWTIDQSLPSTAGIKNFVRSQTLTIKAMDGSVIHQTGPATRETLTYDQIPPLVIHAFIAAEDRRFYQHHGIDYQSILRAVATNIVARDVVEGGSTITQQLARIVYLNQDRNLDRKLREAMMAQKIDRELSKEQILERYLNLVYLGSEAYGVADAAWVYFSKPVSKLTLGEAATIAGLPPAPSE